MKGGYSEKEKTSVGVWLRGYVFVGPHDRCLCWRANERWDA